MEWVDLVTNDDLKPKVEVTGAADRLSIRIGRTVCDQLGWAPGTARLQYANDMGRAFVKVVPDASADWLLQSGGKGGGLNIEAVQLAPSENFSSALCSCELGQDGSAIVTLPMGFKLAAGGMLKRRKSAKANTTKSSPQNA